MMHRVEIILQLKQKSEVVHNVCIITYIIM